LGSPEAMAQKEQELRFSSTRCLEVATDFMSNGANHNSATGVATEPALSQARQATRLRPARVAGTAAAQAQFDIFTFTFLLRANLPILRVLQRSARSFANAAIFAKRFCAKLEQYVQASATSKSAQRTGDRRSMKDLRRQLFWRGTPTALTTAQLEFLLEGFHQRLDLSALEEWTIEANPGSVSARKAALLYKLRVNRISLGVQSWDNTLLKILGREHNADQAEQSFHVLRDAGSQTSMSIFVRSPGPDDPAVAEYAWEKRFRCALITFCLLPDVRGGHGIFLRQSRGELKANPDSEQIFPCGDVDPRKRWLQHY